MSIKQRHFKNEVKTVVIKIIPCISIYR